MSSIQKKKKILRFTIIFKKFQNTLHIDKYIRDLEVGRSNYKTKKNTKTHSTNNI